MATNILLILFYQVKVYSCQSYLPFRAIKREAGKAAFLRVTYMVMKRVQNKLEDYKQVFWVED